jgi:serine/threonine-protein kinase RsbW/non-specific serine/threonine protein kinase
MERRIDLKLDPNTQCTVCQSAFDFRATYQGVEDWMRVLGYPLLDVVAVQVALREAAANAVNHGNRHDPSRCVQVRYLITPDEVVLEVEDEGEGFDPALTPDPLAGAAAGRFKRFGLFMMRAYMDWVAFNTRGNLVTLGRKRSAG